jgi:TolA-binding protein
LLFDDLLFPRIMRLRSVLAVFLSLLGAGVSQAADGFAQAWRWVAEQRYAEARAAFEPAVTAGGAGAREARLGLAVALLGVQPKTQGNVSRAREVLAPLAGEESADEWALQARYFLGRIAELHEREPDLALARRFYRGLFEEHPGAPIAQAAAVKYVLLALNAVEPPATKRATIARMETLSALFVEPSARRDYHVVMAYGYLRHAPEELASARRHALAAEAAGFTDAERRRSNLLRIAELSRALDDTATARAYYEQFLAEAARDTRALLVRERLAALPPSAP